MGVMVGHGPGPIGLMKPTWAHEGLYGPYGNPIPLPCNFPPLQQFPLPLPLMPFAWPSAMRAASAMGAAFSGLHFFDAGGLDPADFCWAVVMVKVLDGIGLLT